MDSEIRGSGLCVLTYGTLCKIEHVACVVQEKQAPQRLVDQSKSCNMISNHNPPKRREKENTQGKRHKGQLESQWIVI